MKVTRGKVEGQADLDRTSVTSNGLAARSGGSAALDAGPACSISVDTTISSYDNSEFTTSTAWRVVRGLQVSYAMLLVGVFMYLGAGITPDLLLLLLMIGFALPRQRIKFLRDFLPLVLLLFSYDALRGYADELNHAVHVQELIDIERFLFAGSVPSVVLQRAFMDRSQIHWYDQMAIALYVMHFIAPVLAGALLWQYRRADYVRFVIALTLLSYAGFVTFLAYPAAPPWLASELGALEGVRHLPVPWFTALYLFVSPNDVAAMPSLHGAYPVLLSLFAIRALRWWGGFTVLYALSVWIAVVYLGHHYVVDLLAGAVYALAAYRIAVSERIWKVARGLERRIFASGAQPG